MIIPLDLLIENQGNMYQLTCAIIKRAVQINIAGDEELKENKGKVVSTSIKQVLTKKVDFELDKDNY